MLFTKATPKVREGYFQLCWGEECPGYHLEVGSSACTAGAYPWALFSPHYISCAGLDFANRAYAWVSSARKTSQLKTQCAVNTQPSFQWGRRLTAHFALRKQAQCPILVRKQAHSPNSSEGTGSQLSFQWGHSLTAHFAMRRQAQCPILVRKQVHSPDSSEDTGSQLSFQWGHRLTVLIPLRTQAHRPASSEDTVSIPHSSEDRLTGQYMVKS